MCNKMVQGFLWRISQWNLLTLLQLGHVSWGTFHCFQHTKTILLEDNTQYSKKLTHELSVKLQIAIVQFEHVSMS